MTRVTTVLYLFLAAHVDFGSGFRGAMLLRAAARYRGGSRGSRGSSGDGSGQPSPLPHVPGALVAAASTWGVERRSALTYQRRMVASLSARKDGGESESGESEGGAQPPPLSAPTPPLWTLPNVLSATRVAMIPFLGLLWSYPACRCALYVAAAVTDFLDGFLARKMKLTSRFGAFLDPVADKLMVSFSLVLLAGERGYAVAVPAALILCREVGVSALRERLAESGERDVVAVGFAGKVKTTLQLIAVSVLLACGPGAEAAPPGSGPWLLLNAGLGLLALATAASLSSGYGYLKAAWPALTRAG